ncbi:MAG: mechanosensitive ion channel domain-containing protein [Pseudomonadota bacterium]
MDTIDLSALEGLIPALADWPARVVAILFATAVLALVANLVLRRLHSGSHWLPGVWDDALLDALRRPLPLLVWTVGLGLSLPHWPLSADGKLLENLWAAHNTAIEIVVLWFVYRLFDRASRLHVAAQQARDSRYDDSSVYAVSRVLKLLVVLAIVLVVLNALGVSVTGALAFGGIGGIAVGFAAKDLLSNFFGGLMIFIEKPFVVGDWVRSPDREIEGTVEDIGWRLTRISTFDRRPIYVPNAIFNTIVLENPSRMANRRLSLQLRLRLQDLHRVEAVVTDIRQYLEQSEAIDQTQTLMVNFDAIGESALSVSVYCFTRTTSWAAFQDCKQAVLFAIADIVETHGAALALPARELHVTSSQGVTTP